LSQNGNPNPPPRLRVVEDLGKPVSNDAGAGSSTPIPPGVQILEGDVLYREWVPGPAGRGWIFATLLPLAITGVLAFLAARTTLPLRIVFGIFALFLVAMAATAFNFRGLSIVVDRNGMAWRFGIFSRRYALAEISMFRERIFHFPKAGGFGGWGIGKALDGVDTYEVWGANGTAVDLVVRRGDVTKHYLVSTAAPDRLVVQLVRAMERSGVKS
jgi:hypothetical protein